MVGEINVINGKNLSDAWGQAVIKAEEAASASLKPAIVQFPVHNNSDDEIPVIRKLLEDYSDAGTSVETVAGTIFPYSIWMISKGDRREFYKNYTKMFRIIKQTKANNKGTYFQRLIDYSSTNRPDGFNQLEHIINTWNRYNNHRLSALQAGVFNPEVDHSNKRQSGFPCLQQLVFEPLGTNGRNGLCIIAFYANQSLIEKAYGNYIGLLRLGKFMAEAMKLTLVNVTCFSGALKLCNQGSKKKHQDLIKKLRNELEV